MECSWLKVSPSINKGINLLNQLDDSKFEQFLRRIVTKIKIKDSEIFNMEEQEKLLKIFNLDQDSLLLAIKTIVFIFKKLSKFIFMPQDLKNDLKNVGFTSEKADFFVKVWSVETRNTLNDVNGDPNDIDLSWKLHAELSSDLCKKSKAPKVYLSLSRDVNSEIELTHAELYKMFLQFENVQKELDNIEV